MHAIRNPNQEAAKGSWVAYHFVWHQVYIKKAWLLSAAAEHFRHLVAPLALDEPLERKDVCSVVVSLALR